MVIGVPKEIKTDEHRVGLTPASVDAFIQAGHTVIVEKSAGIGSGFIDEEYEQQGARIVNTAKEIFKNAQMIIKVKEPQESEINLLMPSQILYTYFHLAADKNLTKKLLESKIIGIAYETIEINQKLVALEPMSEIAGKMSAVMGAYYSAKPYGGRGILPGGVAGVHSANFLILGGGAAGINAAKIACGLGARVVLMDINLDRMRYLEDVLPKNCEMIMSNRDNISKEIRLSDVVIGTVLIPGAKTPKLITRDMLNIMRENAVIVDVSIDQGGCTETSKPTTHSNPVYLEQGILHYCVANMPGAYPRSSTFALTNATVPLGLEVANKAWKMAGVENEGIANGINFVKGELTNEAVAKAHNLEYTSFNLI